MLKGQQASPEVKVGGPFGYHSTKNSQMLAELKLKSIQNNESSPKYLAGFPLHRESVVEKQSALPVPKSTQINAHYVASEVDVQHLLLSSSELQ